METLSGSTGATVGGGDKQVSGSYFHYTTLVPCDLRHTIINILYRCISGEMGAHMCNIGMSISDVAAKRYITRS